MKTETEVKFIIPDLTTFSALQGMTSVGDFWLKPIGTKTHSDRYMDTVDRRILHAGYACRIRTAKQKQLLTLKSLSPPQGEIHRRREIEMEVTTDQPQAWADGEARELVLSVIGNDPLETLFTIHQTRYKCHVYLDDEAIIELSLDEVSLNEPGDVDYYELEAELINSGTETDLTQFVEALRTNWDLQAETRSKFERGLQN